MTLPDSSDSTSEVRVDSPVAGPPNVQSPTPPPEDANTDGQVEQKPPTDSDSSSNSRLSIPRIATSDDLKASAGIEKPPGSIPNIPNANHIVKLLAETPPKFLRIGTPPNEDFNGSALSSPGGPRTADVYTNIANPLSTPFEYQEVQRGRPTTTRKASGSSKAKPGTIRTLSSPPTIKRTRSTPRSIPIPQQPFAQLPSINQGEVLDRRPPFNRSRSPRKHSPTCETKTPNLLALQDKELKTSDAPLSSRDHPGRGHERHPSFPALPLNTYLSLALSSPTPNTPAVSAHSDVPQKFAYPSTDPADIVLERLTNFINLPAYLEGCMLFACLACLDNWLWCFTILPLRFLRALGILADYWWSSITGTFHGGKRLAKKQTGQEEEAVPLSAKGEDPPSLRRRASKRPGGLGIRISDGGERGKRVVSKLQPVHKAEILRGLVVLCSCWILMRMDASKLYHTIRGQAAIKLYVIYNVLEMADRLLAALGQDILECLFCRETLERKENGRSKILRPFLCFLLALAYNVAHTGILFYQVVTLNVAVNSYSNALLTLLMSTQFVEIKASVFKKFEKESLFQLTCSDVVERFQLWLMLMIILMRNLVELGVRSASDQLGGLGSPSGSPSSFAGTVWPKSFMFLGGEAGKIFGPFVMVIGSEMVVDWIKHAFITKFNVIRPQTYSKFLDVLCKDYYSNAFGDQNLHKRLGLPVIPLSCVFIRVSFQTFQILFQNIPMPTPARPPFEATTVALARLKNGTYVPPPPAPSSLDSVSALLESLLQQTTIPLIISCIAVFFIFLALKLALGILLLNFSRKRYKGMKERERVPVYTNGNPVGGFGVVEVDDKKRKDLYEPGEKMRPKMKPGERDLDLSKVERFKMVAKRIY